MKLTATVADPEDLRKYFQKCNVESSGLFRRRSSKSKLPMVSLIDPRTQATNQAKLKIKRKPRKRKGAGEERKTAEEENSEEKKSRKGKENFSVKDETS